MEAQKLFKQKHCFVESFDSIRYTKLSDGNRYEELSDIDKKTKETQAEIELIYALLLGQKIVVPETHSFDSVGFLEIVTKALDARPKKGLERDWIREPFVLSKRASYPSYLSMVSQRLEQPTFILSALSEINDNISIRQELSNFISQGNFNSLPQLLQNELSQQDYDSCVQKIDNIRKINDYFSGLESKEALNLGNRLEQYVRNLINLNNIPQVLQEESGFKNLQDSLITLEQAGIKFYDRSTVRSEGRKYLGLEEYLGIVEYVDSCYNAVIYQAIGANIGILTTTETTQGIYVLLAQRLSEESAELDSNDRIREWVNDRDSVAFQRSLEVWYGKRGDRWQSIWEIMLNDVWIQSANELMQAANETKRDAYKSHLKELQRLTHDYASDISVDETEEYSQSLHAVADDENVMTFELFFEEPEQGSSFDKSLNSTYVDGSTPGSDL